MIWKNSIKCLENRENIAGKEMVLSKFHSKSTCSGGFRGGSGSSLESRTGIKLFQFHGIIYEKTGKRLKTNPLWMDLNPLPEILDPPLTWAQLFKIYDVIN